MTFFKKESNLPNKTLTENNFSTSLNIGDNVIDKDGNNATIVKMFEWDLKIYDEEKKEFFSLDSTDKVKLKYDSGFTKIVDVAGIIQGINKEKKDAQHILETIYSMNTRSMTQEMIDRLYTVITLYADFYKNNQIGSKFITKFSNKDDEEYYNECMINDYCFNSIFIHLKIDLPSSKIKLIYDQFGVIQLREINTKTLILGCGNEPLVYGSSEKGYKEQHAHQNQITMSPELSFNPTFVARFEGKFKFENNFFKEVIFEGFFRRELQNIIDDLNEVKRILAPNGKVSFITDNASKTYNKEQIDLIIKHFKEKPQFDVFRSNLPLAMDGHHTPRFSGFN